MKKPKLKLTFADMWGHEAYLFHRKFNYFYNLLSLEYEIELVENNCDVLIYSVYGDKADKIKAKYRIFFPNEVSGGLIQRIDYLSSFSDIKLTCNPNSSNEIYFPHFIIYIDWWNGRQLQPQGVSPSYLVRIDDINNNYLNRIGWGERRNSISVFINNSNSSIRVSLINKLSDLIEIFSYGNYNNNTYGPFGGNEYDKILESSKFKYSLAAENCIYPGYCSEKILHSFASGAIPLYWGDSNVFNYYDEKCFINIDQNLDFIQSINDKFDLLNSIYSDLSVKLTPIKKDSVNLVSPKLILTRIKEIIDI